MAEDLELDMAAVADWNDEQKCVPIFMASSTSTDAILTERLFLKEHSTAPQLLWRHEF